MHSSKPALARRASAFTLPASTACWTPGLHAPGRGSTLRSDGSAQQLNDAGFKQAIQDGLNALGFGSRIVINNPG